MATSGIGGASGVNTVAKGQYDAFGSIQIEDFLNLMITELQNQDPLNPTDNAQILQQISQMNTITSTTKLTDTLESVLLGQGLTTASGLIGKDVRGVDAQGEDVAGRVDRVLVESGTPKLVIGDAQLPLANLTEVLEST